MNFRKKNKNNDICPKRPSDDIVSSVYLGSFFLEIASNSDAVVYGVKCIDDYTSELIRLRHRNGRVSFVGRSLSCQSYVEGAVCIKGIINSVHYDNA